jgi:S1-C subfamily serine protease
MDIWKKILLNVCIISLLFIHFKPSNRDSIRKEVNENLVKITNQWENSGGTGFHIISPSGKVYILTNAHVCELKDKNNNVFIRDEEGSRLIPKKVIEQSAFTDLCLVEGLNKSGLKIARDYDIGKSYHVLGHPRLRPPSMIEGELTGVTEIEVLDHIIPDVEDKTDCSLPKNKREVYNFFGFLNIDICVNKIFAAESTFTIYPGNSGSPLFNDRAQVEGVAFAGDSENIGYFITLDDIQEFVKPY